MDSIEIEKKLNDLSSRECEILYWVCHGKNYTWIAKEMNWSLPLVQLEMSEIYDRFELSDLSREERRAWLFESVCPIHKNKVGNPETGCAGGVIEVGDPVPNPATLALVIRDEKTGLIPYGTQIQDSSPPPPPFPPPLNERRMSSQYPRDPYPPKTPNPLTWLLIGILATLLLVAVGIILYLLSTVQSLQQSIGVPPTARVIQETAVAIQTVVVPQTVIVPQTVSVPQTVIATSAATEETFVPTSTSLPLPTIPPTPRNNVPLPFADNFNDGLSKVWQQTGGDWNMSNGQLHNGADGQGIMWLGSTDWTDVTVEVDLDTGGHCTKPSLLLRMQDPDNYIKADIHGDCFGGSGFHLIKDGKEQKSLAGSGDAGKHYKIEVVGSVYKMYIDGQLRLSASDETFSNGSVGFSSDSGSLFDNFSVRAYSP